MEKEIRYKKAIIRNLYEVAHALLELKVLKEYEKYRVENEIWICGESFFGISERAIYNDMIAHAIKVLVMDKFDSTTFWYVLDITKTTGTLLTIYSEDRINSLKTLSEKLKIIRDKTHFHIDKIGVLDPHKIWDQANIKGNELEGALQYLFSFLNELHGIIFNKSFLFQPEDYEGKDVSKLLDLANSASLINVIKKDPDVFHFVRESVFSLCWTVYLLAY
jgi:hypothetical protein